MLLTFTTATIHYNNLILNLKNPYNTILKSTFAAKKRNFIQTLAGFLSGKPIEPHIHPLLDSTLKVLTRGIQTRPGMELYLV